MNNPDPKAYNPVNMASANIVKYVNLAVYYYYEQIQTREGVARDSGIHNFTTINQKYKKGMTKPKPLFAITGALRSFLKYIHLVFCVGIRETNAFVSADPAAVLKVLPDKYVTLCSLIFYASGIKDQPAEIRDLGEHNLAAAYNEILPDVVLVKAGHITNAANICAIILRALAKSAANYIYLFGKIGTPEMYVLTLSELLPLSTCKGIADEYAKYHELMQPKKSKSDKPKKSNKSTAVTKTLSTITVDTPVSNDVAGYVASVHSGRVANESSHESSAESDDEGTVAESESD